MSLCFCGISAVEHMIYVRFTFHPYCCVPSSHDASLMNLASYTCDVYFFLRNLVLYKTMKEVSLYMKRMP